MNADGHETLVTFRRWCMTCQRITEALRDHDGDRCRLCFTRHETEEA